VPLARAAKSHDVAERLPSILEHFRNVCANVLPVTKKTLAKRFWAQGDHDTAIGVMFQDAPAADLVAKRSKFVVMMAELFRVVKPGLPDLARVNLNDDLNAWRVRQRVGGNSRHDLEKMIDELPSPAPHRTAPHRTTPAPHPHHTHATPHRTRTAPHRTAPQHTARHCTTPHPEASAPCRGTPAVRRRLRLDVRGHRCGARVGAAVLVGLAREAVCVAHCTLSVGV
jgi:hypothetical protein